MPKTYPTGLMWFRRDLRAHDNAALHHALKSCARLHCAFVFDRAILDRLPRRDLRVEFIRESLVELDEQLRALSGKSGGGLIVRHAVAAEEVPRLAAQLGVAAVFTNDDYELQAQERDIGVRQQLGRAGIAFHTFKDQVVFERQEVLTQGATPYTVFTPYRNAWLAKVDDFYLKPYATERHADALEERPVALRLPVPEVADLGFEAGVLGALSIPAGVSGGQSLFGQFLGRMERYREARDFPAEKGPSYLSAHLRFGTASIRTLAGEARRRAADGDGGAATWLDELIWRDFYFQVLANFPQVSRGASFKPAYDKIQWEQGQRADTLFAAWCEGRTGYPLVDAAMAQINRTGYMHNRLRMVTASFLVKDLGVDWRWGERYFAEKLIDYDFAANNGGWQWAASTGCDAQPYFRIFNPVSQSRKFDARGEFIHAWLPQLRALDGDALHAPWEAPLEVAAAGIRLGIDYPPPIARHDEARRRTLDRYAVVKA